MYFPAVSHPVQLFTLLSLTLRRGITDSYWLGKSVEFNLKKDYT